MNSEQIRKFFADYQVVLKRVEQLEAAMRTKSDWETWCAALRECADFFHTEYARMNAVMRRVTAEFAKDDPDLDDDAWKQLQKSMMDFYRADTHDLALLMEIAKILQKHYGHSSDLAAMTDINLVLAYTNLEFSRILREPYGTRARDYYRNLQAVLHVTQRSSSLAALLTTCALSRQMGANDQHREKKFSCCWSFL